MKILKKTYSLNNNEIVLVENNKPHFTGFSKPTAQKMWDKTILIIGVIHGDEPQGQFLIEKYLARSFTSVSLRGAERKSNPKNELLFIPCLNPDGLLNNTRKNSNLVDINRNFPTKNWELTEKNDYFGGVSPSSEIETKFVVDVIKEFSPDVILTLHAPYRVVNYDGPADDIAERISKIINYPTSKDIGYPTPGSFGTYAGVERNIPTITLELDEEIDVKNLLSPVSEIFDYLADL